MKISRRHQLSLVSAGLSLLLSGCQQAGEELGPPDLRIYNHHENEHELHIMIRSEANPQKVLLNETVRLPPKGEHAEKNIFSSAGTYRAVVNVDGSDAQEFTWTIEEMPVGGGFQLVIDPDGDLYDHVVGSP